MVTINIAELQEDASETLYDFIRNQRTKAFRIVAPFNKNIGEWNDLFAWYQHYYYSFYLAEQFNDISYKASYSFPLTYCKQPFLFKVYQPSPRFFAETILEAAAFFHAECVGEAFYDMLNEKASEFWRQVGNREIKPCCQPSLRFLNILCADLD